MMACGGKKGWICKQSRRCELYIQMGRGGRGSTGRKFDFFLHRDAEEQLGLKTLSNCTTKLE